MVAILDRAHSCGVHHSSIKFVFIITHLKSIVCATPWLCLQLAFFKILNEAVTLGITKKPYQITKKKKIVRAGWMHIAESSLWDTWMELGHHDGISNDGSRIPLVFFSPSLWRGRKTSLKVIIHIPVIEKFILCLQKSVARRDVTNTNRKPSVTYKKITSAHFHYFSLKGYPNMTRRGFIYQCWH